MNIQEGDKEINIEHLKATVKKSIFNKNDPEWIEAFKQYNNAKTNRLGMGCTGCYYKVLEHFLDKGFPTKESVLKAAQKDSLI